MSAVTAQRDEQTYVLGHESHELQRLTEQARYFSDITEHMLRSIVHHSAEEQWQDLRRILTRIDIVKLSSPLPQLQPCVAYSAYDHTTENQSIQTPPPGDDATIPDLAGDHQLDHGRVRDE